MKHSRQAAFIMNNYIILTHGGDAFSTKLVTHFYTQLYCHRLAWFSKPQITGFCMEHRFLSVPGICQRKLFLRVWSHRTIHDDLKQPQHKNDDDNNPRHTGLNPEHQE